MNETYVESIMSSYVADERIDTIFVNFPRIVNAELLRHRGLSFCSASSRAVPIERYIDQFTNFKFKRWSKHKSGMQPHAPEFSGEFFDKCSELWDLARVQNIEIALKLNELGASKEQVNRLLEPFSFIPLVISGTEYAFDNFFKLRCDSHAQYEMRETAEHILAVYNNVKPVDRLIHAPFVDTLDFEDFHEYDEYVDEDNVTYHDIDHYTMNQKPMTALDYIKNPIMQSVARTARTSYYNFEGKVSEFHEDLKLYNKLVKENPPHLSPSEFVALNRYEFDFLIPEDRKKEDFSGNLHSEYIIQFRKILEVNLNVI